MPEPLTKTLQLIGVAADHGGFKLKEHLVERLRVAGYEIVDFGAERLDREDDYPDFVVPLGRAVARGRWSAASPSAAAASARASSRTKWREFGHV